MRVEKEKIGKTLPPNGGISAAKLTSQLSGTNVDKSFPRPFQKTLTGKLPRSKHSRSECHQGIPHQRVTMKIPGKAFTFIEIIVVLAIIVVLVGMLLNVFKGVRDKALRASCANNMSQIIRALNLYLEDYPSVDRPPGSSINEIYGCLYYISGNGKAGGISTMKGYVCPATTHLTLIPKKYGASLDSNWTIVNGSKEMTDYLIIKPETDPYGGTQCYPNFRKTPKGNAVLWENILENHKSGRHVGFWDQRVRFINSDIETDYPINLDYSTGKHENESIHKLIKNDTTARIIGMDDTK